VFCEFFHISKAVVLCMFIMKCYVVIFLLREGGREVQIVCDIHKLCS
jgi:hypothetical protein